MAPVEDFIYQYDRSQKDVMLYLHHILVEEFTLTDKLKFKLPFYYRKSWICYLKPTKSNTVELAFLRGNELSNSQGLLEHKGRKQVWSIDFTNLHNIPVDTLKEVIQEALILDDSVPYASKRRK
jgi:hypothetical protein